MKTKVKLCVHYWVCENGEGDYVNAECKYCGAHVALLNNLFARFRILEYRSNFLGGKNSGEAKRGKKCLESKRFL